MCAAGVRVFVDACGCLQEDDDDDDDNHDDDDDDDDKDDDDDEDEAKYSMNITFHPILRKETRIV